MASHRSPASIQPIATVRGADLWRALGFDNARAFQRAHQAGRIGLRLYPIPGQSRGLMARADELAAYLVKTEGSALASAVADRAGPNDEPSSNCAREEDI